MDITAQVVLINSQGLVLGVSRKTDHTDFGLCGGKMEPIDYGNPEHTAVRETFEETGLRISNLRLIFAMHKNGNMGYTYLADYEGEINHNEPHMVKWLPFQTLLMGSFGKYNELVLDSLKDMGVSVVEYPDFSEINDKLRAILNNHGYELTNVVICRNWGGSPCNEVCFTHANGDQIDEDFYDFSVVDEISKLGKENGLILTIPSDYYPK